MGLIYNYFYNFFIFELFMNKILRNVCGFFFIYCWLMDWIFNIFFLGVCCICGFENLEVYDIKY